MNNPKCNPCTSTELHCFTCEHQDEDKALLNTIPHDKAMTILTNILDKEYIQPAEDNTGCNTCDQKNTCTIKHWSI